MKEKGRFGVQRLLRSALRSFAALLCVFVCAAPVQADVGIKVTSPAGSNTQTLPGNSGQFNVQVPIAKNTVNTITVMATDTNGNVATKDIKVTQISFDSLLVAQVTAQPLTPEQIEQLVADGVIDVDDPNNFNVSQFSIVLTIAQQQVPITLPIVIPKDRPEIIGTEIYSIPGGDGQGSGRPPDAPPVEVVVFQFTPSGPPGFTPPPIPGVIVIDGRIKTLKEFYSVKFLMMNTSGIFTLQDVSAMLEFPDGGLTNTLPEDGVGSLGDILPGSSGMPGQSQKEFIVRGDEIGTKRIKVSFGGKVGGAGIPEGDEVAFNGSAETSVEVKGPPKFTVRVTHPDNVVGGVPYKLGIEIQNSGDTPALYTSLDLDVGFDARLLDCNLNTLGDPVCVETTGPQKTTFGHILPGQTVRKEFDVKPLATGPITSCMGIADQNITLQVSAGNLGCLIGQFSPDRFNADGIPAVSVLPGNNFTGVSLNAPVTGFFTRPMQEASITTGLGGTLNVYDDSGVIQPGELRYATLNGDTVVVWQFKDGITNRLSPDTKYTVEFTQGIKGLDGKPLISKSVSTFTTTGEGIDDFVPPVLTLGVEPGVNPNNVLPGQVAKISAYPTDQGSGIRRVELRLKDLDTPNSQFKLVDQKKYTLGDTFPYFFSVDSKNLIAGHTYQLKGTAYDGVGNPGESTITLTIATVAPIPTVTLPVSPGQVLKGVNIPVTPLQVTGGTFEVSYFVDDLLVKTVGLLPYQVSIPTIALSVGTHTFKAVARDGLNQTGQATFEFDVLENTNAPVVLFSAPSQDADVVSSTLLGISANISDPVGVKSVKWYFDSPNGTPFAQNVTSFALNTTGIPLGAHRLYVVATNNLDLTTSSADPSTFRDFEIIVAPPEPAPPAPTILNITVPINGDTTVSGMTSPNRRVDITNSNFANTVSVLSDGTGAYSGSVAADSGDTISVLAFNAAQNLSSTPATILVPTPTAIDFIEVNPSSQSFSNFGAMTNLQVIAHYVDGGTENVTSQSTFVSTNGSVAGVDSTGKVVSVGNGVAVIQASYSGFTVGVSVTVDVRVLSSISVSPNSIIFNGIGNQQPLSVTGNFSDATTEPINSGVLFQTGDPQVATVNSSGVVTAVGNGSTGITVFVSGAPAVVVPVSLNLNDATAPTVSFSSPANGADVQRGQNVTVNINAQDTISGVKRVSFTTSGEASFSDFHEISPVLNTTESFNFVVPQTAAIGGTITLNASALDDSGNPSSVVSIGLDVVDSVAPTVSILAPAPETEVGFGDQVALSITANDAVGVTEIRYTTEGSFGFSDTQSFTATPGTRTADFTFTVPFGLVDPDVTIRAYAKDASGNEREATPIHLIVSDADIIPPATTALSLSAPGAQATTTVNYTVTDGLADLDHVELYFRRNGIGTFNRYTDAAGGNPRGEFQPQAGANGSISFDSTRAGGDGAYEFYTVGVDLAGNREAAPTSPVAEVSTNFATGAPVVLINANTFIAAGDTAFDNQNLRIVGASVTVDGAHSFKNIELLNGATLAHAKSSSLAEFGLNLSAWTLTVDSTSFINLTGLGYLGGLSGGLGTCEARTIGNVAGSGYGAGGSHGGMGGKASSGQPNPLYGSLAAPVELGSGGGCGGSSNVRGGDGGGRMQLTLINFISDGRVSADGGLGQGFQSANGSGGSIYLVASTVSGLGLVSANGFTNFGGSNEVGGGGGRIAVHFVDVSTLDRSKYQALGGSSGTIAGNGTVFFKGIDETNGSLVIDGQGASTAFSSLPIPPGFTFDNITIRNGARVLIDTPVTIAGTLSVESNSILTHSVANETGLQITAARVFVDSSSTIDVTGKGYRGGLNSGRVICEGETLGGAPGSGYKAGGAYGGTAGTASAVANIAYGDPRNPDELGSGGGCGGSANTAGGNGGGRIEINASESVQVDGALRADGQNSLQGFQAGNGSGGSVRITTSLLKGIGVVSANGAAVTAGSNEIGGSGGRIAVYYDFVPVAGNDFNGLRSLTAFGGHNGASGSAGTLYLERSDKSDGDLYIDDGFDVSTAGIATTLPHLGFGRSVALTETILTVDGSVVLPVSGLVGLRLNPNTEQTTSFVITANTVNTITVQPNGGTDLLDVAELGDEYALDYKFENVILRRGAYLVLGDKLTVADTLDLSERSVLSHYSATTTFTSRLDLEVENLIVAADSRINLDGRGYSGGLVGANVLCEGKTLGNAPGSGYKSGGSYGGRGGILSNSTSGDVYGSVTEPAALGSGGGCGGSSNTAGGNGGGWLRLVASNVNVLGAITANGLNSVQGFQAGNGSGGTLNFRVGALTGSGILSANGFSPTGGANEVAGGGGRIAIRYQTLMVPAANLQVRTGAITPGGTGSLYLKGPGQAFGDLVIDGQNGASNIDLTPLPNQTFDNLILRNQARISTTNPINVQGAVQLLNGSSLTHPIAFEQGLQIHSNSVLVDETSSIDVSARGYRGGLNSGRVICEGETLGGSAGSTYQTGGSFGGLAGQLYASGGPNPAYGTPQEPLYLGSGGGCGGSSNTAGGNGGGRVDIQVVDTVILAGSVLADGQNSLQGFQAGNGSGGSVRIQAQRIAGSGQIRANGFSPQNGFNEVGGSGGRIALHYSTLGGAEGDFAQLRNLKAYGSFVGTIGGAGTVYTKQNGQTYGDLYFDAGRDSLSPSSTNLTRIGFANVAGVNGNVITTDASRGFVPAGLVGLQINPDLNQNTVFTIVTNTANSFEVTPSISGIVDIGDSYAGVYHFDNVTLRGGVNLALDDKLIVEGELKIIELSSLTHFGATTSATSRIDIGAGSLTLDAGTKIDVDGKGYLGGLVGDNNCEGRTLGNLLGSGYKAGGSYGGLGGTASGVPNALYGDASNPNELGSGGGCGGSFNIRGGNGGGQVRIAAGTFVLNGNVLARGLGGPNGFQGGNGSGGSLNIAAISMSGAGSMSVQGMSPSGFSEVGGGGGRIKISAVTNTFSGTTSVAGGTGAPGGGAGTLVIQ